jgi:tRNA modification GTPase
LLWFAAPHSVTGEDLAELHVHGGRSVVRAVLDCLSLQPGLRPAEPGEFTKRAFLNGKLDLTAAEGLNDLISADTAAQRRQALRQMSGELAALYEGWRERLLGILAWLEADIDFSDEDLPAEVAATAVAKLRELAAEVASHLDDGRRGEILREGMSVAIIGAPNVGKSSIINRLARKEVAIVSEISGTTRDVIEVRLELGGYPVLVADTAGLRSHSELPELDPVEREGVRRALARADEADLSLFVYAPEMPVCDLSGRTRAEGATILVLNKTDLLTERGSIPSDVVAVSAKTGDGFDRLEELLRGAAGRHMDAVGPPLLTRARHRAALTECLAALQRAVGQAAPELQAEDVRLATRALGRITGRVAVDEVLDVVFREFCIGK